MDAFRDGCQSFLKKQGTVAGCSLAGRVGQISDRRRASPAKSIRISNTPNLSIIQLADAHSGLIADILDGETAQNENSNEKRAHLF